MLFSIDCLCLKASGVGGIYFLLFSDIITQDITLRLLWMICVVVEFCTSYMFQKEEMQNSYSKFLLKKFKCEENLKV